jgi:hypothetical protein
MTVRVILSDSFQIWIMRYPAAGSAQSSGVKGEKPCQGNIAPTLAASGFDLDFPRYTVWHRATGGAHLLATV